MKSLELPSFRILGSICIAYSMFSPLLIFRFYYSSSVTHYQKHRLLDFTSINSKDHQSIIAAADLSTESSSSTEKLGINELDEKKQNDGHPLPSSPTFVKTVKMKWMKRRPRFVKRGKARRVKTIEHLKLYRSYNSSEIYNLTKDFNLNVPDLCESKSTSVSQEGVGLIIIVFSAVGNYLARIAIRNTWGGYAVTQGAKLAYLLGNTVDQKIQFLLTKENQAHNDIIQGQYVDNYQNLTLKTVSMMRWLYTHCENKVKFVLKVDDDVFVNMPMLFDALQDWSTYRRTIIGRLAVGWRPIRRKWSKYYLSTSDFPRKVLPTFTTGPSYIFTADAVADLYNASVVNTTFLPLEDVFMTGVVAERAAVKRVNHPGFFNRHLSQTKSRFISFLTSHRHSPLELVKMWGKPTKI